MAVITYHGHSGFSVHTAGRLMVFDYLGKGLLDPKIEDRALAFVSHAHSDHCHASVEEWQARGLATRVIGYDVKGAGIRMNPGETTVVDGVIVRAFGSTDQGVSFWVEADGLKFFHAGDYNLWHWRGECDAEWSARAERDFAAILKTMDGLVVDVACFPVDPRMGEGTEEGALRFAKAIRPKWIIPMHFWDHPEAAKAFAELPMPSGVTAVALTKPGDTLTV